MGVTAVLTAERTDDYGPIARFGVEEFIADNVMILRNVLEDEKRRRTIEILKFRGTDHQKGEFPFTIVPARRRDRDPALGDAAEQKSSNVRISSGNAELDEMCGGGFFRDSVILVSGATGTGKTLTVTQFLQGGATNGERCLLLAFEESRDQLFRNATGWGFDFEQMERDGLLRWSATTPRSSGLEDWLVTIQATIAEFKPNRVALDSLSALERVGNRQGVPRVRDRADVVHQAPGDHRPLHVHDAEPDGRATRSPRRTSRRSPTRSSCCATWRCSAR